MATLVRIDDRYINLDNVAYVTVEAYAEEVTIHFNAVAAVPAEYGPGVNDLCVTLHGEQGARLLKWLDAGGRVSIA